MQFTPIVKLKVNKPHGCAQRFQQIFTSSFLTKSQAEVKVTRYLRKDSNIEDREQNKKTKHKFFP